MAEVDTAPWSRLDGLLSLVIPVHNEAQNLPQVIPAALEVLAEIAPAFEIVLVDDASQDDSVAVAAELMGEQLPRLRVLRHPRQAGYGLTVADGLRAAAGDWVAFCDGDGQFDPRDLRQLAELAPAADLVAGWRISRADPWHRALVSGTFNVLVRALYGVRYRDVDCGFKLMRSQLLRQVSPILARSALLNTEIYFKASRCRLRIRQVGIVHHPRLAGVRSGGRLIPILRAVRDLVLLRIRLAVSWKPPGAGRA